MRTQKIERKMLGARVDVRLIKALKFLALETDRPVYDLLEEAMRDLLAKYGRPVPEEGQGEEG